MKAPTAHAFRLAACLLVWDLVTLAVAPAVLAQTPPAPGAAAVPAPPYQDRYILGGTLAPDISTGDYGTSDPSGLARSIRVEAVASILQGEGANAQPTTHENGLIVDTQWDTASYGAWSANAAARLGGDSGRSAFTSGSSSTSFALHERAMPFDDGWQTDNGLGDLTAPLINLERLQPRFLLAQGPMLGVTTEWRGPSGIQVVAGGGEPGIYSGIKVPTFDTLGGSTATLGAQWSPVPQWTVGGEFASAHDVAPYYTPIDPLLPPSAATNQKISSNTGIVSAAWQNTNSRAQLNLIDGTLDGNGNAFGAWADFAHTRGAITQTLGVFRIDPNLSWGNQLITSDVQGGYYRLDYQSRRWLADVGVDEVKSVSGLGSSITFLNADARYQLSRDTGIGGVANVRYSEHNTAWSVEGYLDNVNGWGTGRAQADYATDPQTSDSTLTLQQTWNLRAGSRLATSVAVDRIRSTAIASLPQSSTIVRLAAYGGADLTARFSIDGSIQYARAVQGRAAPNTAADISLTYQIARSWGLLFSYYENRLGSWTPLVVSSPLTPPTPTPQESEGERGFFLTLRYQEARGAHFMPLGGVAGSGSGRLSGVVYLDANENGHFDAGESGAANVTVILDGRFSVRTDANGRYDFPAVASGHHMLTVQTDNLPLPWTLANAGHTEVDVSTRDRTVVDVGALRLK